MFRHLLMRRFSQTTSAQDLKRACMDDIVIAGPNRCYRSNTLDTSERTELRGIDALTQDCREMGKFLNMTMGYDCRPWRVIVEMAPLSISDHETNCYVRLLYVRVATGFEGDASTFVGGGISDAEEEVARVTMLVRPNPNPNPNPNPYPNPNPNPNLYPNPAGMCNVGHGVIQDQSMGRAI